MPTKSVALALMSGASLLVFAHAASAAEADTSTVGELVVTAPRQEVKARAVQLQAPNIVSVQSAQTILKYPDYNAAEALGRMPGISLSSDTGEGRFVQIRGIDANLDGATYGGVPLLNTNPGGTASGGGGRAVEFDTIPTGAVDGIIVTYTLLPDHEAEGLGGSIELSPRTAVNVTKPFFEGTLGWGYEPLHDRTGPFEADIAFGARFGFDEHGLIVENGHAGEPARAGFISNPTPFSFVISGSRQDDRRAVDDLEESYIDDGVAPGNAVSQYDLRRYDYHRRRFSYGAELDFQPNDDHSYYARGGVAGYTEAQHKNFLLFTNLSASEVTDGSAPPIAVDPNNPNGYLVTTNPDIALTDEEEVHRNTIFAIGGTDRFGDVQLDYRGAYSRATFHIRRNIGADFIAPADPNAAPIPFTYDNVTTPNYPIFGLPSGFNVNDPGAYALADLTNAQDYDIDEEYSGAANLSFPLAFINDSSRLKVGAEVRLRDKSATEIDQTYIVPPLSLAGLSGPALTYYNGHYSNGPQVDLYAVRNLINSGAAVLNPDPTLTGFNPTSFITAIENIYAGYAQYTTTVGKFGLLAGVRVEATNAIYGGFVQTTNPDGTIANAFLSRPVDYINAFPTVQAKYSFTPTLILRATYSSGLARPGFEQNSTAASVDRTASPIAITRGNPNLQPTFGNNFDLSLEYYLANGGIVSLSAFDKEFRNYIVPRISNGITTDPLAPGELANVTTFLDIPTAYARGVQAAYHQKFVWLPKPFDGFGVEANLTLVDSRIQEYSAAQSITGLAQYGLLPGTSQVTWNLAGFYEAYGIETRIAAEYVSHSLFGLGGDQSLDTLQDSRLTVDLTASYKVNPHWTVYFDAKNLTNEPLRYYEGSPNRPIQREFYDITYEGGVRASF
ncbi:MAG: TonB-dependent receptor [Pseudomonadota bacterium]|nr:TonB-dependent receptor [Pseudomonadota bacterium]